MRFSDLIKTAFTNLYRRKARTLLTILGVIIGTMSIVLMVALGEGSKQVFMEQVSQSTDLTQIQVYMGRQSTNPNSTDTKTGDDIVEKFEQIEHVRNVLPVTNFSAYMDNQRYIGDFQFYAVPFDKMELLQDKLEWGKIEKSKNSAGIVMGKYAAQWFYQKKGNKNMWELPQATDIDFSTAKFSLYLGGYYLYTDDYKQNLQNLNYSLPQPIDAHVEGMFAETGTELDYSLYIDLDVLRALIKANPDFCKDQGITVNYQTIYVYADEMSNVQSIVDALKADNYECYSPMEYIQQMQEESARQQAQWGMVGAIALLVSAIGIINTMLTSIMERKREIGILKVLGCPLPSISSMFLIEAAIIGMFGGTIGVALSYGIELLTRYVPLSSGGVSFFQNFFSSDVRFVVTIPVALGAIFGSALIGMVAGIYPSIHAMRMSALEALKDE